MSAVDTHTTAHAKAVLRQVARRLLRRPSTNVETAGAAAIRQSGLFDATWYLDRYPDVEGMDPVLHYVRHGVAEGRNPRPDFDTAFYLERNPDVVAAGMNPFLHYIEFGQKEHRPTLARAGQGDSGRGSHSAASFLVADAASIAGSGMFDKEYYLAENRDVAAAGLNPLEHFCRYGHRELRNPCGDFDIAWYWLTQMAQSDASANPLLHYLARGVVAEDDARPVGRLDEKEGEHAKVIANRLLERGSLDVATALRLGVALSHLRLWPEAEEALGIAVGLNWKDANIHARLATLFSRRGKWWQAVESWKTASELDATHPEWFFHLGEAQEKMNRFELAADAYQRAIDLNPGSSRWFYLLGYAWEKAGDVARADAAYAEALALDPRKEVEAFGIGMLHQKRGYWPEAAEAYAKALKQQPALADLHFRLGMAHDRCYRWPEAEQAYRNAIALKPESPAWHYRFGFVLERQHRYAEAAEAYAAAATLSSRPTAYWWYRCGYVLAQAGRHEEACRAYLATRAPQDLAGGKTEPQGSAHLDQRPSWLGGYFGRFSSEKLLSDALARDMTNADFHYLLGESRERCGDWLGAAEAYAASVSRSDEHRPMWYYRLGFTLFRAGNFQQASDAFRETRILRRPFGVDIAKYEGSEELTVLGYNEYLETLPVREKYVLYESMHGSSVGGNPYAIFEYLSGHPDYSDWIHVWVISSKSKIPDHLRNRLDVILVTRQSDLYARYLATASHLISDVTFPYWFIRRPEQRYLNTWHGTPLKKLGKDIPGEFMAHGNVQRNFLQATHLISPNQHTSDVLMKSYDVGGITRAKLAETGYPRIDRMLKTTEEKKAGTLAGLGLTDDLPVVLYAPTWRGAHGHANFDVEGLRGDIEALSRLPCQLLFRGHHMIQAMLDDLKLPVASAGQDIDTSDVLAVTDVLITDYSSILFDFLPANKPVFLYCHDWQEYAEKRGLYFNAREMPGGICESREELIIELSRQLGGGEGGMRGHAEAIRRFCPMEDGASGKRVADFFINDDDSHVIARYSNTRRSLLFFAGHFIPNGITSSFLNLIRELASSRRDHLSVVLDTKKLAGEPAWREKLAELPPEVSCLPRFGTMIQSPEECWVMEKLGARKGLPTEDMWGCLGRAFERERRRLFGDARIDAFINFEGYSGFWTALFGPGASLQNNVSYLHNDMIEEYNVRHPYLASIFGMHRYYDMLVSVSEHMSHINREKMGSQFGLPASHFAFCTNVIDSTGIRQRATEPLDEDLLPWMEARHCFLTMGRMSPEKDQAKLIEAFHLLAKDHPDARLVILGDGPLRNRLQMQVQDLGLQDIVLLAGQRGNPFPALARCSCFVLPSNHEGQPMVLLEAMVLGCDIIATDIDGNRGLLQSKYGALVENSVSGLKSGMENFIAGNMSSAEFNVNDYVGEALGQFHGLLERCHESSGLGITKEQ